MAALWGKMRHHLTNMRLHTELDISATYLRYMEKQVKSSNTKITTMIAKSTNEPEPEPAPKPAAKSNVLKRPAGKAVMKVHTKK